MKDFSKYSAIIIGAGDATGSAITKKFASHGYKVCPVRRPKSIDKVNKLADEVNGSVNHSHTKTLVNEKQIQIIQTQIEELKLSSSNPLAQ